jgi:hypothetical protein
MCRLMFLNIFVSFFTSGLEYVKGIHFFYVVAGLLCFVVRFLNFVFLFYFGCKSFEGDSFCIIF